MKTLSKLALILGCGVVLSACDGGSSSSADNSTSGNIAEQSVFVATKNQVRTPGSSAIPLASSSDELLKIKSGVIKSSLVNSYGDAKNCFVIKKTGENSYDLNTNSSQYYSTVALGFTVENICDTPQQFSNLQIDVESFAINNAPAQIGWVQQNSSNPYLTLSYKQVGTDIDVLLSTPSCSGDYCSWAEFPAKAEQSFVINASVGTSISTATVKDVVVHDGDTPPPPPVTTGSLLLKVDSNSLKSICTKDTNCDIQLNVVNSNGVVLETANIDPYSYGNYSIEYDNLLTGVVSLRVDGSTYPKGFESSISYTTNPVGGSVNITSGGTSDIDVTFAYTKPEDMGTLKIKLPTFAESSSFNNIGQISGSITSTDGKVYNFAGAINGTVSVAVPANQSYTVSILGVADPLLGVYYTSTPVNSTMIEANSTQAVNLSYSKLSSNQLHQVVFNVTGDMPSGQLVKFGQDASSFEYNNDLLVNGGTYLFVESPVALTVTVGDIEITPTPSVVTAQVNSVSIDFGSQPVVTGNPYNGASFYLNTDYAGVVDKYLAANPDMKAVAKQKGFLDDNGLWKISTAVWLDRIAAISSEGESHGITWHLAQAYTQAKDKGTPVAITFVVYDLPDRDCAAYSSNGEIVINKSTDPDGTQALQKYKSDYIDAVYNEFNSYFASNPIAKDYVRVALVIEPDSLPNTITNATDGGTCQFVASKHIYQQGVAYALSSLSKISNVSMYLDIAHSGWMGWSSNVSKFYTVYNDKDPSSGGLGAGFDSVRGFITNTANYTPLNEAFTDSQYVQNNTILSSKFYEWNDAYSEAAYIGEIMSIQNNGTVSINSNHTFNTPSSQMYKDMHFLVDTSRNGWATSTTNTDGSSYSRKDERHHRGNWCNIQDVITSAGSVLSPGMGSIPQANPNLVNPLFTGTLPMDAYVWIKPPGESDGNYDATKGTGDQMCGAGTGGSHNANSSTDALQDKSSGISSPAPKAGVFFPDAFDALLVNANSSD